MSYRIADVAKCEREDSNLHGLPHWILNPARLPIPPLSHILPGNDLRRIVLFLPILSTPGPTTEIQVARGHRSTRVRRRGYPAVIARPILAQSWHNPRLLQEKPDDQARGTDPRRCQTHVEVVRLRPVTTGLLESTQKQPRQLSSAPAGRPLTTDSCGRSMVDPFFGFVREEVEATLRWQASTRSRTAIS
jgi:hypothetical protein